MSDERTLGTEIMLSLAKRLVFAVLVLALSFSVVSAGQNETTQKRIALLEKTAGAFSFVVLGDNRSGDDRYAKLISLAMERRPHFIVNTGDQIPHPGDLDDWKKFWKLSAPVTVPYFLTVGNHDVKNARSENTYRQQVMLPGNELYYSFRVGSSLFIVLDTYLTGEQKKIVGEQYRWLEELLSKAKAQHIFVFLHHPLYAVSVVLCAFLVFAGLGSLNSARWQKYLSLSGITIGIGIFSLLYVLLLPVLFELLVGQPSVNQGHSALLFIQLSGTKCAVELFDCGFIPAKFEIDAPSMPRSRRNGGFGSLFTFNCTCHAPL